jgi:hypothetical protein
MALPNLPWTTQYPGLQDTGTNATTQMPTLTPDSSPGAEDGHRVLVEHVHALRNKLQSVALKVGDNVKLPVGSLVEILDVTGTHAAQVRLGERTSAPAAVANTGFVYTKDVSGTTELFYRDSAGNELQLTNVGQLKTVITTKGDIFTRTVWGNERLAVGLNGQVLTSDSSQTTGLRWATPSANDPNAIHVNVRQEINGLTLQSSPNPSDIFVLEAYSEVFGSEWAKRKIALGTIRQGADAYFLQGRYVAADAPSPGEVLAWTGTQWEPQAAASISDRVLVFSDETELSTTSAGYDTLKTFSIVNDSNKAIVTWRLLVEAWYVGGTSADVRLSIGGESPGTNTVNVNVTSGGTIFVVTLSATAGDQGTDWPMTVQIDARSNGGGTAYIRYTDLYGLYA